MWYLGVFFITVISTNYLNLKNWIIRCKVYDMLQENFYQKIKLKCRKKSNKQKVDPLFVKSFVDHVILEATSRIINTDTIREESKLENEDSEHEESGESVKSGSGEEAEWIMISDK